MTGIIRKIISIRQKYHLDLKRKLGGYVPLIIYINGNVQYVHEHMVKLDAHIVITPVARDLSHRFYLIGV